MKARRLTIKQLGTIGLPLQLSVCLQCLSSLAITKLWGTEGHVWPLAATSAFSPHQSSVAISVSSEPREILLIDDTIQNVKAAAKAGWNAFRWSTDADLKSILK